MASNLKNLKKFPGNKALGGEFMLFPVDEKNKTVADIPKLPADRVNVRAIIPQGKKVAGKRVRPLRPILCLVSELPDEDQAETILRMRKEKILEMAQKKEKEIKDIDGERTVSMLIKVYKDERVVEFKTAWTVQQILKFWDEHLGNIPLEKLTPAEITSVKKLLKDKAPKTQNNMVSALCSCFDYGVKNLHWLNNNPVKDIAKEKVDNKIERYLSDDELKRFKEGLEKSESPTLKVLGYFGLATGCRISEAEALTWKDIDFEKDTITFNGAKRRKVCTGSENGKLEFDRNVIQSGLKNGSKAKLISLKNLGPLRGLLLEHKIASTSDLVFPHNVRTAWKTLLRNCEIKNFRFHDLRHTCASYLVQAGVELLKVAAHLGHKNIQSTLRYAHLSPKVTEETGEAVAARIYG